MARVGTIYEVKLAMAFFGTGTIDIQPTTTNRVADDPFTSIPDADPVQTGIQAPYVWATSSDPGKSPYDNPPLPPHGVYNDPAIMS